MSTATKRVGRPRKDTGRGESVSLLNIPRSLEQKCGQSIEVLIPQLIDGCIPVKYDDMMAARARWQGEERRKVRVDRGVVRRMLYESDGRASWLAVVLLERWLAQAK